MRLIQGGGSKLEAALEEVAGRVEAKLDDVLPEPKGPEARLAEAMRYAIFGRAKRFRPFLAIECGRLFNVDPQAMLRVAAAIECVHTYSLIHDDLPCMDDDPMRRGRASVHVKFDEATAVLAGDALLTFGFEILASPETHTDPRVRIALVSGLARAIGPAGMVGGQMIDLEAETKPLDVGAITRLQRMKTGALIVFACEASAHMAHAKEDLRLALNAYAHDLGLAFQITDDLLDATGTVESLGKTTGKDAKAGKATFVSVMGLERAREQAGLLATQAVRHLDHFDQRADLLRSVPEFLLNRTQ